MVETIFDHYLKAYGKSFLFQCNFGSRGVSTQNDFINDICTAWSGYAFSNPTNDLKNQIIWNNGFIQVDRKIVFYREMYENGIVYVKDLYDDQNNILSISTINRVFSLHNVPFTRIQGLVNAIPAPWKRALYPLNNDPQTSFKTFYQSPRVSQLVYKALIHGIGTPPTAIKKWEREFSLTDDQWQRIFRIPFTTLRETKIQYFQFRFLHRLLGTNH